MNQSHLGAFFVVLSGLVLGSAGAFVKTLQVPVLTLIAFRVVTPLLVGLAFRPHLAKRIAYERSKNLLIASSLTAIRVTLWILAFLFATMSKSILVLHTWPLFFTLFSCFFLGEKIGRREMMLLLFAFFGICILFLSSHGASSDTETLGLTLMLCVALLNGIIMTIFKHELSGRSVWEVVVYDNLVGAVVATPYLLIAVLPNISWSQISFGLAYGLLIGFIGYIFLYAGIRRLPASIVSVLFYTEVVSATGFGVIFFGEEITPMVLLGGAIIILSAWFIRFGSNQPPKKIGNL